MIEVEKKFQPTKEQLEALLKDADFLGEKVNHDIYYDFEDLRLFYDNVKLRNRNGNFELKIDKKLSEDETDSISHEIEDEEEIKKYLQISVSIEEYTKENMIVFSDYVNNRKKYKKGAFIIDLDNMDFGYELCEVELLVDSEEKAKEASDAILSFVKQFGIEIQKIPSKRETYLRLKNPELYEKINGFKK
ncbi:MAG: CYTH domain-containing protein [Candidatus Paceibacterota bacterium]